MSEFVKTKLRYDIEVENVITLHYFEYTKTFAFTGEAHDFWEIVFADKGSFYITAGNNELCLEHGQMYIHRPMEFHNIRCDGKAASNSVIITFSCDAPELFQIAGTVLLPDKEKRDLMAAIISETQESFSTPLGDPYTVELIRKSRQTLGSEQLIKLYLEILLIKLLRSNKSTEKIKNPHKTHRTGKRVNEICSYLEENCDQDISFKDICTHFSVSGSVLKKLFSENLGCGVMEYFANCKIEKAKLMLRENVCNISEIAASLSYSSVYYFSRTFKKSTGMTPSEYASSVKSLCEVRSLPTPPEELL